MDQGTYKSYIAGYLISIVLTLGAYFAVVRAVPFALAIILVLAVIQLVVQMLFFLHVAAEPGRRSKLAAFSFTLGLLLIIVIGSLWIMNHLNYNMMANPAEMQQYINDQQGF